MYFNSVKHPYSSLSQVLKIAREKNLWSGMLRLGKVIKLILFKKVDMFIVAFDLSSKIRFPDLKSGQKINPIVTHEQIASLNEVVGLSNYKPDCINLLHKIFSNGGYGFIAFQNGNPIGTCWASEKTPAKLFHVPVPLKPGDICVHTFFVSQLTRGLKYGEALASYRLWFLQKRGYKRAIAIVDKDNMAALKVNRKIGYCTIGEVSGLRLLFWSRVRYIWY